MAPRASVLIPLYIYPLPGAWDPLYQAAAANPGLDFTVVVNPNSGPGSAALPDGNYTREIPKLTTFPNIRTLGYVATGYGNKGLDSTLTEIATYAGWGIQDPKYMLDGVFFDETPTLYNPLTEEYLKNISTAVQETDTLAHGFVVHNPGTVPDPRYMDMADITIVFEQTHSFWLNNTFEAARNITKLQYNPYNMGAALHSIPQDMADTNLEKIVGQLRRVTGHVFLTNIDLDYYHEFSPYFRRFVDAMAYWGPW